MKLLTRLTAETADNTLAKLIIFKALFALASDDYSRGLKFISSLLMAKLALRIMKPSSFFVMFIISHRTVK